MDLV
jgi:hypothetical protein